MDRKRIIAMWFLYRRYQKYKRRRMNWVNPINQKREESGLFHTLFEKLRNDKNKFFDFFHMSIPAFDELYERLKYDLQRQNTKMRNCIQPLEMLAITIRYLASGCSFTNLHYTFSIGISTATCIVRDVCFSLWSSLRPEFILTPSKEQWESIATGFENKANFPHCLGAIGGKYMRIIWPANSGSNSKDYLSVALMAVADSNYRFVYVDVRSFGKNLNASIFKRSPLWISIENNMQELPAEKSLPGAEEVNLPYFFVGDKAFALHRHLQYPYSGSNLPVKKRVFNYRLCRARRYVECTFGILSNKWRIFHRPLNVNPDFAVDIVKACIILHNFVHVRDSFTIEDTLTVIGLKDLTDEELVKEELAENNIRNILADYFLSDVGAIPWQMSKI